jgi:hypothetical protein
MFCVSVNLTSNEWHRIRQVTDQQWPNQRLSRAEILRRCALAGLDLLRNLQPRDQARLQRDYQLSQVDVLDCEKLKH